MTKEDLEIGLNGNEKTKIESEDKGDPKKKNRLDADFSDPKEEAKTDLLPPVAFIQLYRFSTGWERFILFIGLIGGIGTGLSMPINVLNFGDLSGVMVDFGSHVINGSNTADVIQKFYDGIHNYSIYMAWLGAGTLLLSYISTVTFNYVAQRMIYRIRDMYLKSALQQDIGWYDTHQTGDFASRMSEDLNKLEEGMGEKVIMFINFMVAFIGSVVLALVKGWELALICLISFPISMISMGFIMRTSSRLAKQELEAYGNAGSIAEEVFSSIRTVIAFGGEDKEVERYKNNLGLARNYTIRRSFLNGIGFGLLWFFIYGSYALAFWYGVGLIIRDKPLKDPLYTPSVMVTVFFSVMTGSMNFGFASPFIEAFAVAKGAAAKVYNVIDRVSPINSMSEDGEILSEVKGCISFRNVHFQYPSRKDVKILAGFNLIIKEGQTVALVGNSGCGKSTCIQLIQRFYDPEDGSVEFDGHDIRKLNVAWFRQHIGVVGQEPVLFQTTIAENIRYGNDNATIKEIEDAARLANAHDFIIKLPQGYNTMVGERGAQISGGQKQRIAIARALVRQPKILLLDEATSALDTNSEAKVQHALEKASVGRTTIIVAHRLSTIRGADKIIALSEGKVVEEGSHEELMQLHGHYYKLVMAQISPVSNSGSEAPNSPDSEAPKTERMLSISSNDSIWEELKEEELLNMASSESEEKINSVPMMEILKLNKPEWLHIVVATICSFIMGCAMPIFAVLFGDVLGVLAKPNPTDVRNESNYFSILCASTGVGIGIATFIQIYLFGYAGEKLTTRLREMSFSTMVKQEVGWFDDKGNNTGALCARLSGEASSVQGATGQRIGTIFQALATVVLAISLAMYYEWRLGLVALAFTPVVLLSNYFHRNIMQGETLSNKQAMEKSTKLAVEAIGNIRTVVGLGREKMFHHQYMIELEPAFVRAQRNTHVRAIVYGLARSVGFFAYSACMFYGGHLVVTDGLPYSDVFKVAQSLLMGTMSVANALAFTPNFQKGMSAAANIFHLLRRDPMIKDPHNTVENEGMSQHEVADGFTQYRDVSFKYPTRPTINVLHGLNLEVFSGKTVALVGPSGCGKSTCVQLLERFYDPTEGSLLIDKVNIAFLKLNKLRTQLGIVSQEPVLFDRTIAQNIAYGDNTREIPMQEIIEAAKKANIHNFITSLPQGYSTRLGEKGTQLSGGQKQRVAIARALIRNPRVLLLDEATSALDTESEKMVQEALDKAKEGRTCIIIAHRLSTIQDADVIAVLNQGKVAEIGTHKELISLHGLYFRLQTLQLGQH